MEPQTCSDGTKAPTTKRLLNMAEEVMIQQTMNAVPPSIRIMNRLIRDKIKLLLSKRGVLVDLCFILCTLARVFVVTTALATWPPPEEKGILESKVTAGASTLLHF
jgi:hypothetical protein